MFDNSFMLEAMGLARAAFLENEVPVGAVIVDFHTKEIIAKAHNLVETYHNPTMHAEIIAIQNACKALGSKSLSHCDIYVTLEPCPMCASAISFARIRKLFYAAQDAKLGAVESNINMFHNNISLHKPEVYSGICENISKKIIQDFFIKIRKKV